MSAPSNTLLKTPSNVNTISTVDIYQNNNLETPLVADSSSSKNDAKNEERFESDEERYWMLQYSFKQDGKNNYFFNYQNNNNNDERNKEVEISVVDETSEEGVKTAIVDNCEKNRWNDENDENNRRRPHSNEQILRGQNNSFRNPLPPLRRLTSWICTSSPQPMVEAFENPNYRSVFTGKLLIIKGLQFLFIFASVWTVQTILPLWKFHQHSFFQAYFSIISYLSLLIGTKFNLFGSSNSSAIFSLFSITICLSEICATLSCNADPYVILCILLVLSTTFIILGALCYTFKVDILESNNIFIFTSILILLVTIGSMGVIFKFYTPPKAQKFQHTIGSKIANIFIPTAMTCESIILLELSELYQIINGFRIPLIETSLLHAASHLL